MDLNQINQVCNAFRAKYKSVLIQSGLARFVLIILAVGFVSGVLDCIFHLGIMVRLFVLSTAIFSAGFMFWWTYFVSVKKTWSDKQILAYLDTTEESNKRGILELFELIKSENIQETNNEIGRSFIQDAVNELNQKLSKISYGNAVKTSSFKKWVYALAGVMAMIGILGLMDAEKTKIGAMRFFNPFSLLDWPSRTKVNVFPPKEYTVSVKYKDNNVQEFKFDNVNNKSFEIICGDDSRNSVYLKDFAAKQFKLDVSRDSIHIDDLSASETIKMAGSKIEKRTKYIPDAKISIGASEITITEKLITPWSIPQMESLKISALVSGEIPSQATIIYKSSVNKLEIKEKINVAKNGEISYEFPSVKDGLSFRIVAGDYETREQKISVIQRPYLKKITADYQFPVYAGIPNKKSESGQLTGLEGTKVTLTFESSMPLSKAVFNWEGVGKEDLKQISETTYTKTLMLEKNGAYSIELYEKSGFRESRPERFEIKVDPDAKPVIEMYAPGSNLIETKNALIPVSFKVTDDFGIKTIGLYYKINESDEFKLLSDKITGPITVGGKKSDIKFDWDLRKMNLPETAVIHYYIKVQDVNPTNNGVTVSANGEIQLVKPIVFHQEAILKAKVLITEGKIALKNQIDAFNESVAWVKNAENKVDDNKWSDMAEKQASAFRAIDAMTAHLSILSDKFERNRMQKEFMSVRLNSVISDMHLMVKNELSVVANKLSDARPKNDTEAKGIKEIRLKAQKIFEPRQKMSTLYMERILKKLHDWSDLQETSIKSTNIYDRQISIQEKTVELIPKIIGVDPQDLSDADQTSLADLAKQQKAIYEAESSLEQMLVYLIDNAKKSNRKSIQGPLTVAFKHLRAKQVNDTLKKIDIAITDNRCSMITGDQTLVADVMKIVKAGLEKAGLEVEVDQPLTSDLIVTYIPGSDNPPSPPNGIPPVNGDNTDVPPIDPPDSSSNADPFAGSDKPKSFNPEGTLPSVISELIKFEDQVRARLKYLSIVKQQKIMPRLAMMKIRRLEELQSVVIGGIKEVILLADKEKNEFVSKELKRVQGYFEDTARLIKAKDISETHQSFIDSNNSHLSNLNQYIGKEDEMASIIEEHTRQGGKDSFGRLFLAQAEDIKLLSESSMELFKTYVYQDHISKNLERFSKTPATSPEMKSVEQKVRNSMIALEGDVKTSMASELVKGEKLTDAVKEKYKSMNTCKATEADLDKMVMNIKAGNLDGQVLVESSTLCASLSSYMNSIKDLMDERVKPKKPNVDDDNGPDKPKISNIPRNIDNIRKLIEDSSLPADQKEICKRSLSKDFQGKYKDLLAEYFFTIAEEQGVSK